MVRGERRRSPGAPAALRWIAADARDVARIDQGEPRPAVPVRSIARGVRSWQWRVERRRLRALLRRAALAGIAAACLLQAGELVTGHSGLGVWLVPAAMVAAIVLAIGLVQPTSPAVAARLLDRDLYLGAKVGTALELETSGRGAAEGHGLAALALADGRAALATSLAGAHARLRPRHGELALLAALVAGLVVLLLVPSPRNGNAFTPAASAKTRSAPASSRALRADNGLATSPKSGSSLPGFRQAPLAQAPLAAVQAGGAARSGGASSGHSRYGGGVANNAAAGSVVPVSRTLGQSGAVKGTQDDGSSSNGIREGSGSLANGGSGDGKNNVPGGSSVSKGGAGSTSVAPLPHGRPTASAPGPSSSGTAGRSGGQSKGGAGTSRAGTAPGRKTAKASPGGPTAGSTSGGKNRGKGVVPELGGKSALPIAPEYEAVPGAKGATEQTASSNAGRGGGAGHSVQAIGGLIGSGAAGVPYVPPGSAAVASIDRGVVLGYFASFSRLNASGW